MDSGSSKSPKKPERRGKMAINFHFNGRSSAEFPILVESREGSVLPSTSLNTLDVPGMPGAYFVGRDQGVRVEKIQIAARVRGNRALEELREQLAVWLDTSGPVPFFYDHRPERIYQAALSGDTDITKIIFGKVELTFVMPDPFAEASEEKSKGITSPPVTFDRQSTAYLPGEDEPVFPNEPRYMPGKFGEAILVEEGTKNLLATAETPAKEEVTAKQGEVHTLSHDMGSVEVAHQRREDLSAGELHNVSVVNGKLILDRYGEDLKEDIPGWSGTHHQTRYDPDRDQVVLDIATEEDTELTLSQKDEGWADGENEGVKIDGGNIVLSNFPKWDYVDDMKDYLGTGWDPRLGANRISQTANTVRMDSYVGTSNASTALVKETPGIPIKTIDFLCYLTSPPGDGYDPTVRNRIQLILVLDHKMPGDTKYAAYYPVIVEEADLSGKFPGYVWIRGVVTRLPAAGDNGNLDVYINGEYDRSLGAASTTLATPRIQFIMENEDQGRFYLADFKYSTSVIHPTQPSFPFPLTGSRVSPEYDLSELGMYRGSTVTQLWERSDDLPSGAEDYRHQGELEAEVDHPVLGPSGYQPISPAGGIPQLKPGDNLAGMSVRFRSTLRSFDYYRSPILSDVKAVIQGHKKTLYSEGIWTADPIPLDGVGRATSGRLYFDRDTFFGTRVIPEAVLEKDEEVGEWVQLEEDEEERGSYEIPFLRPDMDLSEAMLYIRFRLESEYGNRNSPGVGNVRVEIESAYYEEGYRISPEDDLSGIGRAAGSMAEMSGQAPAGTRIIYEAQLSGGEWVEITGDTIPQIQAGTNLTGATFRTRQRLLSNSEGTATPVGERFRWIIHQDMSNQKPARLENSVTIIPATGHLILTPRGVQRWQLEQKPYPTSFHPDERKRETLYLPASVALNESEGTVSLWAFEDGVNRLKYLLDTDGGGSRFSIYRSDVIEGYRVRVNNVTAFDIPLPPAGQFNQIVVRWKGKQVDAFINGERFNSRTLGFPVSFADTSRIYIGSTRVGERQWNERIDDLHFSNVARSDEYLTDPARQQQPAEVDQATIYLLKFDDSLADYSAVVVNEGTAPTLPRIVVNIEKELRQLKILHIQSGQFLLLQNDADDSPLLRPGDVVELGRPQKPVLINGHDRKRFLTLDSDFFRLAEGENTFEVTEGAQAVAFWKERYK